MQNGEPTAASRGRESWRPLTPHSPAVGAQRKTFRPARRAKAHSPAPDQPAVLENERGVQEIDWREPRSPLRNIDAMQFKSGDPEEPPPHLFEVLRIEIDPHHALRRRALDMLQPVPARDAQHRYTHRPARLQHTPKQVGEHTQLSRTLRTHVPFVILHRNLEPGIQIHRKCAGVHTSRHRSRTRNATFTSSSDPKNPANACSRCEGRLRACRKSLGRN